MLRCPVCKRDDVELKESFGGNLHRCPNCGNSFPVVDGISKFLTVESFDEGFDTRWKEHPKPQATTQGVFELKTGWKPVDLIGKTVLDAGCGCGRFSQVVSDWGVDVIGVDMAPHALKAAHANAPRAKLIQASLLDIPIKSGSLDAAFSIGVLHHTSDPKASFMEVARTVKVGGELAVWLYSCPGTSEKILAAMDFFHDISKACPSDKLHEACKKHAVKLRNLYAGGWGELEQVVRISNSPDDEECISDSHDWSAPQYRFWHTVPEVRGWFEAAGYDVTWVGSFPVSVKGIRRR
jgi:SAM-dependent methyltransferase